MSNDRFKQTDALIDLGSEADLWHNLTKRAFATVDVGGARQNLEVRSSDFRSWLSRRFWEEQGTAASPSALNQAIEVLAAMAVFDGPQHEVFIRVAHHDGNIYLDLGGPEWNVVEVTQQGWHPITDSPVRFYRAPGMQPLPWPQTGGSIADLRPFLNVRAEGDFILAVAWLIGALNPQGPFPIALVQGEQGSAKSTLTKVLRSLVDPADPPHTTCPKGERNLAISAHNSWVQAFDNVSKIPNWLSDALCRLATGGGFKTRRLYHDTDEIILDLCRPQILNGIEDLAQRDDLRDRGILFELPVIAADEREKERDFWAAFEDAQPRILGALLDAVSTALREQASVEIEELPRMADFAAWVTSAEASLPWCQGTFLDVYEQNRRDAIWLVLEHDPLGQRMMRFAAQNAPWEGTPTELYDEIRKLYLTGVDQPASPASMSQHLKRISAALRQVGINVTWDRENNHKRTRKITVRAVQAVQNLEYPGPDDQGGGRVSIPRDVARSFGSRQGD